MADTTTESRIWKTALLSSFFVLALGLVFIWLIIGQPGWF